MKKEKEKKEAAAPRKKKNQKDKWLDLEAKRIKLMEKKLDNQNEEKKSKRCGTYEGSKHYSRNSMSFTFGH